LKGYLFLTTCQEFRSFFALFVLQRDSDLMNAFALDPLAILFGSRFTTSLQKCHLLCQFTPTSAGWGGGIWNIPMTCT